MAEGGVQMEVIGCLRQGLHYKLADLTVKAPIHFHSSNDLWELKLGMGGGSCCLRRVCQQLD